MPRAPFSGLSSVFSISDEQAMSRVQNNGDPRAFALLVGRWEGPIQRLCTRMTGDAHRAEELAQEALARVFARRGSFRRNARFSTFLWRIALNLCYDERRRAERRPESSFDSEERDCACAADAAVAPGPSPDALLVAKERGELVREALSRLPERYRAVVVLRHYEGLKFREIAEVLEIPEGTVKSRMAESIARLNRLLQPVLGEEAKIGRKNKSSTPDQKE